MKTVLSTLMLLTSVVCLLLAAGAAAQDGSSYRMPGLKWSMLSTHNRYRREHRVKDLVWYSGAAATAQRHANKCVFEHSSPDERNGYGENIAAGYESSGEAVGAWGDERALYDFQNGGFSEGTGHFTQMVWKGTWGVGCGAALCDGIIDSGVKQWFLVCNYIEAGNVEGEYRQNVFPRWPKQNSRVKARAMRA